MGDNVVISVMMEWVDHPATLYGLMLSCRNWNLIISDDQVKFWHHLRRMIFLTHPTGHLPREAITAVMKRTVRHQYDGSEIDLLARRHGLGYLVFLMEAIPLIPSQPRLFTLVWSRWVGHPSLSNQKITSFLELTETRNSLCRHLTPEMSRDLLGSWWAASKPEEVPKSHWWSKHQFLKYCFLFERPDLLDLWFPETLGYTYQAFSQGLLLSLLRGHARLMIWWVSSPTTLSYRLLNVVEHFQARLQEYQEETLGSLQSLQLDPPRDYVESWKFVSRILDQWDLLFAPDQLAHLPVLTFDFRLTFLKRLYQRYSRQTFSAKKHVLHENRLIHFLETHLIPRIANENEWDQINRTLHTHPFGKVQWVLRVWQERLSIRISDPLASDLDWSHALPDRDLRPTYHWWSEIERRLPRLFPIRILALVHHALLDGSPRQAESLMKHALQWFEKRLPPQAHLLNQLQLQRCFHVATLNIGLFQLWQSKTSHIKLNLPLQHLCLTWKRERPFFCCVCWEIDKVLQAKTRVLQALRTHPQFSQVACVMALFRYLIRIQRRERGRYDREFVLALLPFTRHSFLQLKSTSRQILWLDQWNLERAALMGCLIANGDLFLLQKLEHLIADLHQICGAEPVPFSREECQLLLAYALNSADASTLTYVIEHFALKSRVEWPAMMAEALRQGILVHPSYWCLFDPGVLSSQLSLKFDSQDLSSFPSNLHAQIQCLLSAPPQQVGQMVLTTPWHCTRPK